MDFKKDYYTILELGKTATKVEIRAAFRRLAKIHHPDINPNDQAAEERFKLINEANEVLSNEILRDEYDAYRKKEEEWKAEEKNKEKPVSNANTRSYERVKKTTTETRIYLKGKITVKYWAASEDFSLPAYGHEINYKITPADVNVEILETEIYPIQGIPLHYLKAFKESELFTSPLPNPIKCCIKTNEGEEHYELELKDIRIKGIQLEGITKHETKSFGLLIGDIYAYTPKLEIHEKIETVSECFGATGEVESKIENSIYYFRKEYYNPDCSRYWGEWYAIKQKEPARRKYQYTPAVDSGGCLQWIWLPIILIPLILYPKLLFLFLIVLGIGLLFSLFTVFSSFAEKTVSLLFSLLFIIILIAAIGSFKNRGTNIVQDSPPSYDSMGTTKIRTTNLEPGDTTKAEPDSLISHYIRWQGYDDSTFVTTLSVLVSDVASSRVRHNAIDPFYATNPFAVAYTELLEEDERKLKYVYNAFDSLRTKQGMDEISFARAIVSCIQSMPYYLVVNNSCTDYYEDDFTKNYLSQCKGDCCVGYEKLGFRSPAEFLSDLKGDCDTRVLLLYQLLKHYNYNVALLTSQYYKHALLAVNFRNTVDPLGLAINIHDRNYYLWETTSKGFNVGHIPEQLQDLDYWNITLLNENN